MNDKPERDNQTPKQRGRVIVKKLREHFGSRLISGAEVGVLRAMLAEHLLLNLRTIRKYYMVDRWAPVKPNSSYIRSLDKVPTFFRTQEQADAVLRVAIDRTNRCAGKRIILKGGSVAMAKVVPDHSLHFVYIDAEHTYPAVCTDLKVWWPKIMPGGLLCGHDYDNPIGYQGLWGVKQAVDEFVAALDLQLELRGRIEWFVAKPRKTESTNVRTLP